jgi:hypothetical protein
MSHFKAVLKKSYQETIQEIKVFIIYSVIGGFIETILFYTKQEWVLPFLFGYGTLFALYFVLYVTREDWKLMKELWDQVWEVIFSGKK